MPSHAPSVVRRFDDQAVELATELYRLALAESRRDPFTPDGDLTHRRTPLLGRVLEQEDDEVEREPNSFWVLAPDGRSWLKVEVTRYLRRRVRNPGPST